MRLFDRRYINLVREFAVSDFKLREQGTVLGFIWTLLHPLLMLVILYMLFSRRLGRGMEHYGIYLLIGILHWNFFSTATMQGMKSIIAKREMLRNIYLPRTAIVVSSVLTVFISFLFELIILAGFLLFSGAGFSITMLLFPFIILIQLLLITGVSLILSCLNVYFRDMEHIWNILLRIGFFLTPIFYPMPMFISKAKMSLYLANPMAQVIVFARDILLSKRPPSFINIFSVFLCAVFLSAIGYFIFKKLENGIIERI